MDMIRLPIVILIHIVLVRLFRILLQNPRTTRRVFALWGALGFGSYFLALVLVGSSMPIGHTIILGLALCPLNIFVAFPFLYLLYPVICSLQIDFSKQKQEKTARLD
jgi:hypothetical protein